MNKQENVDFFNELMLKLDEENKTEETIKNSCLISGDNLEHPIITLDCKHSFNYEPILNEIIQQKKYINNLEIQRLKINQIKCPYCRHVQNKLLPKLKLTEVILGVNYPIRYCMNLYNCNYILKSGKRKGLKCDLKCNDLKCNRHKKIIEKKKLNNLTVICNKKINSKLTTSQNIKLCSEKTYCSAIVKTKNRNGLHCLNGVKQDGYCMIHHKIYIININM